MKENENIEDLKKKIENKNDWCAHIVNIAFDYDGYRKPESLMSLIDELVEYASNAINDVDFNEWIGLEKAEGEE